MEINNMAQLSSPGVSVSVIDESFYTPAAAGTVPLFIVASEQDRQNGAGTGIAKGTTKAKAGEVYLLTSQKDLSDTFGVPKFYTDASNNPIHAGEQNEYGLEAAYSFLGVSNRAYVVRADLDVGSLTGTQQLRSAHQLMEHIGSILLTQNLECSNGIHVQVRQQVAKHLQSNKLQITLQ
jgi:hypothetical protein